MNNPIQTRIQEVYKSLLAKDAGVSIAKRLQLTAKASSYAKGLGATGQTSKELADSLLARYPFLGN